MDNSSEGIFCSLTDPVRVYIGHHTYHIRSADIGGIRIPGQEIAIRQEEIPWLQGMAYLRRPAYRNDNDFSWPDTGNGLRPLLSSGSTGKLCPIGRIGLVEISSSIVERVYPIKIDLQRIVVIRNCRSVVEHVCRAFRDEAYKSGLRRKTYVYRRFPCPAIRIVHARGSQQGGSPEVF